MADDDDIAIVGVGCRFPGADNVEEFWKVLLNGENHIVDIPRERWNNDAYYDDDKDAPGKSYVRKAGLLKNHDEWDNRMFGISDTEAERVDPQQRYALECVHMALEDAGITKSQINGTRTGVYIGCMNDDYKILMTEDTEDQISYSATGMSVSVIAARISYVYNLHGPCLTMDTACSSALYAIHLGCQAIRTGDATQAICGGVSSILDYRAFLPLCRARMMSTVGQCQTFCDTADGYVRGEGCGIVVLKRLKDAKADMNNIWGVIRTGCNQDGRMAQPITAPSGHQQQQLLQQVYSTTRTDPSTIQYIEAHGTGTSIGDPTEVNALGTFFSKHRPKKDDPLLFGSVKSNIGHTESAAGTAGLIKVLLMMKHGKIVPSLHVKKDKTNVNPKIKLGEYNLDIAVDVADWKANGEGKRVACVNSFGFGGSNSHAIITTDKGVVEETIANQINARSGPIGVCISSIDNDSLEKNLDTFESDMKNMNINLEDMSYTSMHHREHHAVRTLLFGSTTEEFLSQIEQKRHKLGKLKQAKGRNIVFLFCGVGTAWPAMCKQMMKLDIFRKAVSEIDKYFEPLAGFRLSDKFTQDTSYDDPFINHVGIFATQVALVAVWKDWNVKPDKIVGQSVGEVAAAYTSGILSLEQAVKVIYHRSKILAKCSGGSMMVVSGKDILEVEKLCSKYESVEIAVHSSPIACTISGKSEQVTQIKDELQNEMNNGGSFMLRELKVNCAYHSPMVDETKQETKNMIGTLPSFGVYSVPIISTVTAELGTDMDYVTGKYWADNVRRPVLLYQALQKTIENDKHTIIIEVGPRQVLRVHVPNILKNVDYTCLPSMNAKKEFESIYPSLSELYELGVDINWKAFHQAVHKPGAIPRNVFNKRKLLHIGPKGKRLLAGSPQQNKSHMYVYREGSQDEMKFKLCIDKDHTPFVYDHFLSDTLIVPGATYVDAAFHIGIACLNKQSSEITVATEFESFVTPSENSKTEIDVKCEKDNKDEIQVIYSQGGRQVSSARVSPRTAQKEVKIDIGHLKETLHIHKDKDASYQCLSQLQFSYGPKLSLIEQSWSNNRQCLVQLVVPNDIQSELTQTVIHPAIVDAMFQVFGIMATSGETSAVPRGLEGMVINGQCKKNMYAYACVVAATKTRTYYNAALLTESGHVIAEVNHFFTKSLSDTTEDSHTLKYEHVLEKLTKTLVKTTPTMEVSFFNIGESKIENTRLSKFYKLDTLKSLDQEKQSAIVLYLPKQNNNSDKLTESVEVFQSLKSVLLLLAEKNVKCPVIVITEHCFNHRGRKTEELNVVGAEVWGMVRSVRYENILPDIRLIDIDEFVDTDILSSLFIDIDLKQSELVLMGKDVYYFKLVQRESTTNRTVSGNMSLQQNGILVSTDNETVCLPFFRPNESLKDLSSISNHEIPVTIETFVLHNETIFPKTEGSGQAISGAWSMENDDGYAVMALEGKGTISSDTASKEVIFCYPTKVESPYTRIPRECVVPFKQLKSYAPGMLTMSCILYKVAELTPSKTRVILLSRKDEHPFAVNMIMNLLSNKGCRVEIVSSSTKPFHVGDSVSVILVCDMLDAERIDDWISFNNSLKNIVTLECFVPCTLPMLIGLQRQDVNVMSIKTASIFSPQYMKRTVPKLVSFLSNINPDNHNHRSPQHMLLWKFPMETLTLRKDNIDSCVPVRLTENELFHQHGCYIIIGGLTGLGKLLLTTIAEKGAGHVASFSRRNPSNDQLRYINSLEERTPCKIHCIQADISSLGSLQNGLNNLKRLISGIPIRGIFHGAGVLADSLLVNQTEEHVRKVLLPKVQGSWNLHLCSKGLPLDFFMMHSSIVSILGNGGQTNYAAANSFIDSLAAYRRSQQLCGQSVNWGALSVGMAANDQVVIDNLRSLGHVMSTEDEIKSSFVDALLSQSVQVCYANVTWDVAMTVTPDAYSKMKYEGLRGGSFKQSEMGKDSFALDLLNDEERQEKVTELIRDTVCNVFVVSKGNLEDNVSFVNLGADSMSAMSFVNSLAGTLNVRIPIMKVLSENANIQTIAQYCLQNLSKDSTNAAKTELKANKDDHVLDHQLTFMQEAVLKEYIAENDDKSLMHLIDFEVVGIQYTMHDWSKLFNHVLAINPELCVHVCKIDGKATVKKVENVPSFVEEISFENLEMSGDDPRENISFTLETEIPLKIQIAIGEKRTVIRMAVHKLVSDLNTIAIIHRDLVNAALCLKSGDPFQRKPSQPYVRELLKLALLPKWEIAEKFWRSYVDTDLKPTSLSTVIQEPRTEYFQTVETALSRETNTNIETYLQYHGLTLFQLTASLYQLMLHMETSQDQVVVTTAVDLRVHVPELSTIATRCVNVVPLISNITPSQNLHSHISSNGTSLKQVLDNSYYPMKLIASQIKDEMTRSNVQRHYLVMENMSFINETLTMADEYNVNIINVCERRRKKETVLYVKFDTNRKEIAFELGFDSRICGEEAGKRMLNRLLWLLETVLSKKQVKLGKVLKLDVAKRPLSSSNEADQQLPTQGQNQSDKINRSMQQTPNKYRPQNVHITKITVNSTANDYAIKPKPTITQDEPLRILESSVITEMPLEHHRKNLNSKTLCVTEKLDTILQEDKQLHSEKYGDLVHHRKTDNETLFKGWFKKQTRQGWAHRVLVTLYLEMMSQKVPELLLEWRRNERGRGKTVRIIDFERIQMAKLNGVYGIILTAPNRSIVITNSDPSPVAQWMETVQNFLSQPSNRHKDTKL